MRGCASHTTCGFTSRLSAMAGHAYQLVNLPYYLMSQLEGYLEWLSRQLPQK
jgi:23S rRNA A2030 N6-methylase RlmJ